MSRLLQPQSRPTQRLARGLCDMAARHYWIAAGSNPRMPCASQQPRVCVGERRGSACGGGGAISYPTPSHLAPFFFFHHSHLRLDRQAIRANEDHHPYQSSSLPPHHNIQHTRFQRLLYQSINQKLPRGWVARGGSRRAGGSGGGSGSARSGRPRRLFRCLDCFGVVWLAAGLLGCQFG